MVKMLVVAPHPDDEVIGMGGTLSQLVEDNDVWVSIITDGRRSPTKFYTQDKMANLGMEESVEVCVELGCNWDYLGVKNIDETNRDVVVEYLEDLIMAVESDEVYVPHFFDKHETHNKVTGLTIEAANNMLKILGYIPDFFGYEIWSPIKDKKNIKKVEIDLELRKNLINIYKSRMEFTDFADTLGLFTWKKELESNPNVKPFEAFVYMDPLYVRKPEWKEKIKECYNK